MQQSRIDFEPGTAPGDGAPHVIQPPTERQRELLVALSTATDLGPETKCRLGLHVEAFVSSSRADELRAKARISRNQAERALGLRGDARKASAAAHRDARRAGARILVLGEDDYPESLYQLDLPPPALYLRGTLPARPAVALVGSRQADPYGLEAARLFARGLGEAGVTVVSGFARGVDGAAHEAALEATGGTSVAFLGCGVDVPYPIVHEKLRQRLPAAGGLVSEFPCGHRPTARNFPFRNRLIAAFGQAVLVVQAARRSGSLITARLALDLGRDVFALPGRIFDRRSEGANALIRDGAHPIQHPDELLELLDLPRGRPEAHAEEASGAATATATPNALLAALDPGEPRSPEEIARRVGRPVHEVLGELLEEELQGRVRRLPGPTFHRAASL